MIRKIGHIKLTPGHFGSQGLGILNGSQGDTEGAVTQAWLSTGGDVPECVDGSALSGHKVEEALQQGFLSVSVIKEVKTALFHHIPAPKSATVHLITGLASPNSHCQLSRKLHCQEASREVQVKDTNSSFDKFHRAFLLLYPANTSWCEEADYSLLGKAHAFLPCLL